MDVGGTKISVDKKILHKVKGSDLPKILTDRNTYPISNQGRIFIDRNPIVFKHMIDYLRSDQKILPKDAN